MNLIKGKSYRLDKKPFDPDDWELSDEHPHMWVNVETGKQIHEETYVTKRQEREVLDDYLSAE